MPAREPPEEASEPLIGGHPMGIGVGAAGGAIAGAAIGTAGGPLGVAVGSVVGAIAGGLAGHGVAEVAHPESSLPRSPDPQAWSAAAAGSVPGQRSPDRLDPALEDAYWRGAHDREPHYNFHRDYADYAPAYRLGWTGRARCQGGSFEHFEAELSRLWVEVRGESRLDWEEARHAVRAAWRRAEQLVEGDPGPAH